MINQISGTLTYNGDECPFTYEESVLSIDVNSNKNMISSLDKSVDIKEELLFGKINNTSNFIFFYIDKKKNGWMMNSNLICNFCLQIVVKSYSIMSNPIFPQHFQLVFSNEKFAKWLEIYFRHQPMIEPIKEDDNEWRDDRYLDLATCKMNSAFNYRGFHIKIKPTFNATTNLHETKLIPGLLFECQGNSDLIKITELCQGIYSFLQLVFHREKVECGEIGLQMHTFISKEKSTWQTIGSIHIPLYSKIEMNNPNISNFNEFGFIEWKNLYLHIPDIFNFIENDLIFLNNLPESISERDLFSLTTISKDAAAFEFHFAKSYPKVQSIKLSNPMFLKAKDDLTKLLSNTTDNDVKNFYRRSIESISQLSLREKALFAVNDMLPIIKKYIVFVYKKDDSLLIDKICKDFRDGRNSVDHGSQSTKLSEEVINAYYIIRILTFAMQLKQLNFGDSEIIRAIDTVFELRI